MREVITVGVGRCGNQIGLKFWEDVCQEHCVTPQGYFVGDPYQLMGIGTHFSETPIARKYVPRALLVDLDPMALDSCRCSPYGQIYRPDNFIFGRSSADNNWGKGHNTDGVDVADYALEALRREVEDCESLSGFSIIHALGGGSGSGLGSLLLEGIQDEYPKKITTSYSVFPSNNVSENTLEPYNTVLSFPALLKCCNMNVIFDNETMYRICRNTLKIDCPSFGDINEVIARVLVGMTCCMRFPGTTNVSLRKQSYEMCPYPDVHFYIPGWAPLNSRGVQPYRNLSLEDIMQQIFRRDTWMTSVDCRQGKFITTETILRGHHSELLLEDILVELQRNNKTQFVPWLDNHCSYGVCSIAPVGMKIGTTFLANHTSITRPWRKIREAYRTMFQRRAFAHWFFDEGMDGEDFMTADIALTGLIDKYEFLENLPGIGGCVTEMGEENPGCNDPPCTDEITNCGVDAIIAHGKLGPVCIDRSLFCRHKNPYCSCCDHLQVTYKLERKKAPVKPRLGPFCDDDADDDDDECVME